MSRRPRTRRQYHSSIWGTGEGRDVLLNLGWLTNADRTDVDADRWRHGLDDGELADPRGKSWIAKYHRAGHVWRDLLEKFQPFAAQIVFEHHEARRVAARLRQALDIAVTDRIGNVREYDRHGTGCLQQRSDAAAGSEDYVGRKRDQFSRMSTYLGGIACGPTGVNVHVAALCPA